MARTIYVFTARGLAEAASAREVPPDAQVPPGLLISRGDGSAVPVSVDDVVKAINRVAAPTTWTWRLAHALVERIIQQAQETR